LRLCAEETALAVGRYKQRIVIELKAAVVCVLPSVLAGGWLDKIARRQCKPRHDGSPKGENRFNQGLIPRITDLI
jgi:hypothetical protein